MLKAVEDASLKSTKTSTSLWIVVFKSFCEENSICVNLETCTPVELNDVLGSMFYAGRKKAAFTTEAPTSLLVQQYVAVCFEGLELSF